MKVDRFVISTYNEKREKYEIVKSFSTKLAALWEYYYCIGEHLFTNLVLVDAKTGKTIKKFDKKVKK